MAMRAYRNVAAAIVSTLLATANPIEIAAAGDRGASDLWTPRYLFVHVHQDVEDQRFVKVLERRLKQTLAASVQILSTAFDYSELRGEGTQIDAIVMLDQMIAAIDWQQQTASMHVLIIDTDIRLRPARYNFAASAGVAETPFHVSIVSLTRLQQTDGGQVGDVLPHRTAERVFKLIAKNTAKVGGYNRSELCLFAFPRNLAQLDATPEGFCEPDLSALITSGFLRPPVWWRTKRLGGSKMAP